MRQRTGILGGTFDPIHVGHLALAEAARRALHLDRVLVLPSHTPPHRAAGPSASAWHRFAMAAMAVAEADGCEVSDLELEAGGFSYTWRTLERLQASGFAADQLYFLTGADAFADIATWKHYPALLAEAHFVAVSRPGQPAPGLRQWLPDLAARMIDVEPTGAPTANTPGGGTMIFLIDAATPDVSATAIRQLAAAGGSLAGLVPAAVEAHIRRHGLYTAAAGHGGQPAGRLHD